MRVSDKDETHTFWFNARKNPSASTAFSWADTEKLVKRDAKGVAIVSFFWVLLEF